MRNREKAVNVVLSLAFSLSPFNTEILLGFEAGKHGRLREQMILIENSVCWGMATNALEEMELGGLGSVHKYNGILKLFNECVSLGKFRVHHD